MLSNVSVHLETRQLEQDQHQEEQQQQQQHQDDVGDNNIADYASRPRITRAPQNYAVVQGESIALECRAVGTPTPTITWTLNDLPLPQV